MFNNFAAVSSKGSANGTSKKESWSLAEVCTAAVLFSQAATGPDGNVKLDAKGKIVPLYDKKQLAVILGRTEFSIGYKVYEDKTTNSKTGEVQCRGIRKYMYLEPTSATNHAILSLADEEERNQIFQNIFDDFKQGAAFKSFEESVLPMVTEFLTKKGFLNAEPAE